MPQFDYDAHDERNLWSKRSGTALKRLITLIEKTLAYVDDVKDVYMWHLTGMGVSS